MEKNLKHVSLHHFTIENGAVYPVIHLSYQVFGQTVGTAPIVLVNHALTGNSMVIGEKGWWNSLIGENKTIDTLNYTIITFNIPGNGYDGAEENLIFNYKEYTARDIARMFWEGLQKLGVEKLFVAIGGSLGGGIAWEMAALEPTKIENLIPVATDWKASDWIIANTMIQDKILNNSKNPIQDARIHAMLLYRSPLSLKQKFGREINGSKGIFQVESWLFHHGDKLLSRFELSSYKLMNHLIKTIDITRDRADFLTIAKTIQSNIHLVAIDSDYFFTAEEDRETYELLKTVKQNVTYNEIKSIHGHDAFLIEFEQLNRILAPVFTTVKQTV